MSAETTVAASAHVRTLRRRDFTLLWTGQAVSELGSRGYGVAIMLWVLAVTGSPALVGLTATVTMAVFALFNVPAGWIVDRFDRKRTMVVADLTGAAAATTLAAAVWADVYVIGHVLATGAVLGAAWCVRGLAEDAALPHLTDTHELTRAVGFVEGRGYAAGLAGPPIATALYSVTAALPFISHALSFLTAAATASRVRTPLRAERDATTPHGQLRDGFRFVWRNDFLRPASAVTALAVLATNGAGLVLIVALTDSGATPVTIGFALAAAYGAGITGSLLVPWVQVLLARPALLRTALGVSCGAAMLMWWGSSSSLLASVAGYALLLGAQPLWHVTVSAHMLQVSPDHLRGRVGGAFGLIAAIPAVLAPLGAGLLITGFGAATTLALMVAVVSVGLVVTCLAPGLR